MAYRVSSDFAHKSALSVASGAQAHSDRAQERTLACNVTIASVALGCVCVVAAGVALFGRARDVGSLPNYVASHKALKVAWVDPPPVRDADVAELPQSAATKVARVEAVEP